MDAAASVMAWIVLVPLLGKHHATVLTIIVSVVFSDLLSETSRALPGRLALACSSLVGEMALVLFERFNTDAAGDAIRDPPLADAAAAASLPKSDATTADQHTQAALEHTRAREDAAARQFSVSCWPLCSILGILMMLQLALGVGDPAIRARAVVIVPALATIMLLRTALGRMADQNRARQLMGRGTIVLAVLNQYGLYVRETGAAVDAAAFIFMRMIGFVLFAYAGYSAIYVSHQIVIITMLIPTRSSTQTPSRIHALSPCSGAIAAPCSFFLLAFSSPQFHHHQRPSDDEPWIPTRGTDHSIHDYVRLRVRPVHRALHPRAVHAAKHCE